MQAPEADECAKLLAGAFEPVRRQRIRLRAASAPLVWAPLAEREQPLFGSKQRRIPRLALLVQRGVPVIQLAPARLQALVHTRQVCFGDSGVGVQSTCERLRDLSLAGYPPMQIEDEVVQADLLEALEDCVDRRALLGDEQEIGR